MAPSQQQFNWQCLYEDYKFKVGAQTAFCKMSSFSSFRLNFKCIRALQKNSEHNWHEMSISDILLSLQRKC